MNTSSDRGPSLCPPVVVGVHSRWIRLRVGQKAEKASSFIHCGAHQGASATSIFVETSLVPGMAGEQIKSGLLRASKIPTNAIIIESKIGTTTGMLVNAFHLPRHVLGAAVTGSVICAFSSAIDFLCAGFLDTIVN